MAPGRASTKRRRTSSSGDALAVPDKHERPQSQDKHELFTQWARHRGVQVGPVRPAQIPGRGVGLVTTASIKENEKMMFVPEQAMFKPAKSVTGSNASPHVQLALSIMAECEASDSPYTVWKETWPTAEDLKATMPLFWSRTLVDMLPPSVKHPLERQRDDWRKDADFCFATQPPAKGGLVSEQKDVLEYYWAVVNSRSFHFKPPGARPGFMVLCPFIDLMNHGPSGTGVHVRQTAKGYEVTANRDYAPGEEVLATYGAHPNDKLLVHYGFINSSPPGAPSDDDIRLDHCILDNLSPNTRGQLQDVGYLGSYALLPAANDVCFKTQVAVRAELLTANEWEYFISNGEDLSGDHSEQVKRWLEPFLERYRSDAESKLKVLKAIRPSDAEVEAVSLLRARWQQIYDALGAFIHEGHSSHSPNSAAIA